MAESGRFRGVRSRTTVVATVVVAVALLVAGASLVYLLGDRLVAAEIAAADLRSRDIAALIDDGEAPDELSFLGDDDGFSQVVASDGTVLAASDNVAGEQALSDLRPREGQSDSEVVGGLPIGDGERFAVSLRSVPGEDGTVIVLAGSSLESADETLRAVTIFLLIGSPALVGIVAVITLVVVNRSLAPVEGIRRQVTEISQQDLHKRVPEPGTGDEIDRLASSMNEMLERLERSSDRQARFVADASHELRSPLASARTTLEVAAAHPESTSQLLEAINDTLLDHDRIEALLRDLLTLARFDDVGVAHTMIDVDLRELLESFASTHPDERLGLEIGQGPVLVNGHRVQLERVLTNLVDNALAQCRNAVEVTLLTSGRDAVVLVDDNGPGIAEADRDRVFDRFVRLDEARTFERGTGLGLAIVREIVTAHRGSVDIADSPLGGARLSVRIPLLDGNRSAAVTRPSALGE